MNNQAELMLAEKDAEIARLTAEKAELQALLPPDPDPDLIARAGRCQPCNLYISMPGDPDGYLLGKLPTPEWAAHVIRAINTVHYGSGTVPAELLLKAAALRQFSKQILDGPAEALMRPSVIAELALDAAADLQFEARELAEVAEAQPEQPTGRKVLDLPMDGDYPTVRAYLSALLTRLWSELGSFSGKYGLGDSDWYWDLYIAVVKAGMAAGTFDEDGCLVRCDEAEAHRLIHAAIAELAVAR